MTGFSAQDSDLALGEALRDRLKVSTKSGTSYEADLVILGMGVRPETTLAKAAELKLGDRGGIKVNPQMQTSDPQIWAVGDAVEVPNFITRALRLDGFEAYNLSGGFKTYEAVNSLKPTKIAVNL